MDLLDRLWSAVILNLLWLVCCLPVVTIGPATAACYETTRKRLLGADGYLFRTFFDTFRVNFRQTFVIGLLGLPLLAVGALTTYYALVGASPLFWVLLLIESIVGVGPYFWAVPLAARFENTTFTHFRNGLVMGLGHLGSTLLLVVGLTILGVAAVYAAPLLLVLPIGIMAGWTYHLERLFRTHGFTPAPE